MPAGAFWELEILLFELFKPLFTFICPYLLLFTLNYPSQGLNSPLFTLSTLAQRPYLTLFALIYPYTGLFHPYLTLRRGLIHL